MKATDLMIGDWVRMLFGLPEIRQIKYPSEIDDADFYEPIPLTGEILEKNGFKHYAENMYENYELTEDYYSIEAKEANDGLWRIKVEHEEIFNDTEICSVSYIHQLQQFFRLCGIKKEIVL